MKAIIKRELKNYLKNPIFWLGLILMTVSIYQNVSPFLHLHYAESESELKARDIGNIRDADISEGYVPSTKSQQLALGYEEIKNSFMNDFGFLEKEADQVIDELEKKNITISEISVYLAENYEFYDGDIFLENARIHRGTVEEVNTYMKEHLDEKPFTYYFSRKFADFGGLYMGFFSVILLAFLYIRDTRKDTYELLHTKPVSAARYITGKAAGGFCSMALALGILNLVFGVLAEIYARSAGMPVRFWDILAASAIYILPNLLMITSVYTIISVIFKNPLPGIPLLFLYMVYSNMGTTGPDGTFDYYGRPLAIMVRFPGNFFETSPPPYILMNQIFLFIVSALLLAIATTIWKKRRI